MRLGILCEFKVFHKQTCSNWSFSLAALTNRKLLLNACEMCCIYCYKIACRQRTFWPFFFFFFLPIHFYRNFTDVTVTMYSCNMCTVHCMHIPRQPSTFGNCLGYNRAHCITYCNPQCSVLVLTTYFQYDEWNGGRYCCFYFSGLQKITFLLSRW